MIVKAGRKSAKRELPERFIRAIDAAAMRSGARTTDAYLADWRRAEPVDCGDDLEAEAEAAAARLEAEYDDAAARRARRQRGPGADMSAPLTPSAFEPRGKRPPPDRWPRGAAVEHPPRRGLMERLYDAFEPILVALAPLMARIGFARLERPVAALEAQSRGRCSIAACAANACCPRPACRAR